MSTPPPVAHVAVDHSDPWKEDGNIVLTAEGKYFRVHRSILSAYSEVFRDMFDCAHQNQDEKMLIERCPVVHLHDVATDVQIMLLAMYDRSYPVPHYEQMHISIVSAFLRLGEKYVIPAFVKEAKVRLRCVYDPISANEIELRTPSSALFPAIAGGDPHNFQIMNLLQEMDLKALLPMAMYQCVVTCPVRTVVDGYKSNDSFCSLSPANLRSFIVMKDAIESYQSRLAKSLYNSSRCAWPSACTNNIRPLWVEGLSITPPLSPWHPAWDKFFCENCRSSIKSRRNGYMNDAWSQIPTAFGFQSWEELRKSDDFPSFTYCAS